MNKRLIKLWLIIVGILTFVLLVFDISYALGYIVGSLISLLLYYLTVWFTDLILSKDKINYFLVVNKVLLSCIVVVLGLLLGVFIPQYTNILALAFGMMSVKIALLIDGLKRRDGDNEHNNTN